MYPVHVGYEPKIKKKKKPADSEDEDPEKDGDGTASKDLAASNEKKPRKKVVDIVDPETQHNTKLNALLYHTSTDTVDMYKQENNSSDLLGRLYYDDYDSESLSSPILSGADTPLMSPVGDGGLMSTLGMAGSVSADHFQAKLNQLSAAASTPSLVHSRSSSSTNLAVRPPLSRLRSLERGVSFDTSTDDHRRSFTIKVKHPHFKFRRNNKTYLSGFNNDPESIRAIEWLFDEMVVNGDTIIVLQVLDEKQYDRIDKVQANKALNRIESLNKHFKKVQIVFEVVIGKPQKLLKKAIDEYNPQMMSIGTHHANRDYHKSFLSKASISKHFLECALVPVIVVKPTYHHVEYLEHPIDCEDYFLNLTKSIDTAAVPKEKSKRMSKLNPLSPSTSRHGSHTNLASLVPARGSHTNLSSLAQERGSHSGAMLVAGDHDERGRSTSDSRSGSVSRSTSRSTSKSRSSGFAKFFHHH